MTRNQTIVPEEIWRQVDARRRPTVFALRMTNGTILRDVAINARGIVEGLIVGGHDGVRPLDSRIREDEIDGIKSLEGLWGWLGLNRWIRRRPTIASTVRKARSGPRT
jgi:hypothetical protein